VVETLSAPVPSGHAHAAKIRNAIADAKAKGRVGSVAPRKWPIEPEARGERDAEQHHPPAVARRVGRGDELGSVAQFGAEDHPETSRPPITGTDSPARLFARTSTR
jgi:hypothetical protein